MCLVKQPVGNTACRWQAGIPHNSGRRQLIASTIAIICFGHAGSIAERQFVSNRGWGVLPVAKPGPIGAFKPSQETPYKKCRVSKTNTCCYRCGRVFECKSESSDGNCTDIFERWCRGDVFEEFASFWWVGILKMCFPICSHWVSPMPCFESWLSPQHISELSSLASPL